jgi:hypothetical protein
MVRDASELVAVGDAVAVAVADALGVCVLDDVLDGFMQAG